MTEKMTMDYQTMLADMETKKVILERAIASLKDAIAAGALGVSGDIQIQPGTGAAIMTGGTAPTVSGDIPKGAFLGKSMPDSIILYLTAMRKRCPTNQIIEGLKKGGIVSTSKTFDIVVGNTLRRLKREGKLLVHDDGWGLPEWVPEGLRSRMEQQVKNQPKKRGARKKSVKAKNLNIGKSSETQRPKELIEKYFLTHQGIDASAKELSESLNLKSGTIALILAQLSRQGWLEKTVGNKFRRSSKVTPISKVS